MKFLIFIFLLYASKANAQLFVKLELQSCPNCFQPFFKLNNDSAFKKTYIILPASYKTEEEAIYNELGLNRKRNFVLFNDSIYHALSKSKESEIVLLKGGKELYRNDFKKIDINKLKLFYEEKSAEKQFKEICIEELHLTENSDIYVDDLYYIDLVGLFNRHEFINLKTKEKEHLVLDKSVIKDIYLNVLNNNSLKYDTLIQIISENPNAKPTIEFVKAIDSIQRILSIRLYNYRYQQMKGTTVQVFFSKIYLIHYNKQTNKFGRIIDIEKEMKNEAIAGYNFYVNSKNELLISGSSRKNSEKVCIYKLAFSEVDQNMCSETKICMPNKSGIDKNSDGGLNVTFGNDLVYYWYCDTVYNATTCLPEFAIPWAQIRFWEGIPEELQNNKKYVVSAIANVDNFNIVYLFNNKYYFAKFDKNIVLEHYTLPNNCTSYCFLDKKNLIGINHKSGCLNTIEY